MKYPIGIQDFEQIIEGDYVYLDKTALVYDLVTNGKIYFLCRPRRFGKSLLVSTLKCYFEGKKELFKGLAIDKLEKEWKQYPVFHLDFNGINFTDAGMLDKTLLGFVERQEKIYGRDEFAEGLGSRFVSVLKAAHEKTGLRAVVLIDEYDKPLLDVLDQDLNITINGQKRKLEEWNREVLKGFYSVFKAADADLQFVLLTGVTKFSQVSVFSGFNQPDDISMDEHYEALCGITEEDWNMNMDSYLLDFPNDEVKNGFLTLVATSYLQPKESTDAFVLQVVSAMDVGDCHQLENLMTSFFASIPYNQRRKDDEREKERYFQYTFYLVLRMISCFTVFIEKQQSEGRVDCVVETPNYIYIFEFKRDGSAEEALKQIEDMGYAREYAADGRKIYQIGCNFSSKTGTIDGWKMK
jgi:hypothetical protein